MSRIKTALSTSVFAALATGFSNNLAHAEHPGLQLAAEAAASTVLHAGKTSAKPGLVLASAALRGTLNPVEHARKAEEKVEHVSLVLVGDTGFAPSGMRPSPAYVYKHGRKLTFAQSTAKIAPHIDGDINFSNLETVVSSNGKLRKWPKKYVFMTHPNGVKHLIDRGFNMFSMANNHTYDHGKQGVLDSIRHMNAFRDKYGVTHAGIGLNNDGAAATPVRKVKGMSFAFGAIGIGAASGGVQRAKNANPGQLNLNSAKDKAKITANLKRAEADYRILSVHRGPERYIRPTAHEVASVRNELVDPGDVDLLIGHHAHVTRGLELRNGRLIVYGLGNFLHNGTANMGGKGGCRDYSIVVKAHLVRKGGDKPKLAALEVLPITATHVQPRLLPPRQAARRIAIMNGLAAQFDRPAQGSSGIRLTARRDGTGLFCTAEAQTHASTRALCRGYEDVAIPQNANFSRAVSTCGRHGAATIMAGLNGARKQTVSNAKVQKAAVSSGAKTKPKARKRRGGTVIAPKGETYAQKRARWKRKEYTAEEVAAWKRYVARKKRRRRGS